MLAACRPSTHPSFPLAFGNAERRQPGFPPSLLATKQGRGQGRFWLAAIGCPLADPASALGKRNRFRLLIGRWRPSGFFEARTAGDSWRTLSALPSSPLFAKALSAGEQKTPPWKHPQAKGEIQSLFADNGWPLAQWRITEQTSRFQTLGNKIEETKSGFCCFSTANHPPPIITSQATAQEAPAIDLSAQGLTAINP